jgi:hypothetical protein
VTFKTDPQTVEQMQARVLGFEKPWTLLCMAPIKIIQVSGYP